MVAEASALTRSWRPACISSRYMSLWATLGSSRSFWMGVDTAEWGVAIVGTAPLWIL